MGRMRVYDGSWDLPEATEITNPFLKYIVDDEPLTPRPATPTTPGVTPIVCHTPISVEPKTMTLPREYISNLVWYEFNILIMCFKRVWSRAVKKMRKGLQEEGLQTQLPSSHPLLHMHLASLTLSHPKHSPAVCNYMANITRVLSYGDQYLKNKKKPATHWSDLLRCGVEPFVEYLEK